MKEQFGSTTPPRSRKEQARSRTRSAPSKTSDALQVITIPSGIDSEPPRISPPPELRAVRFGCFQPDAREVFVVGSFNGWNPRATPLQRDALGDWSAQVALPPGEHRYRLIVDGEWRDDPNAQQTVVNPFGGFDAVVTVV